LRDSRIWLSAARLRSRANHERRRAIVFAARCAQIDDSFLDALACSVLVARVLQSLFDNIMLTRREDPRRFPRGPQPHGPRTRREYLAFLRWSGQA
jgi:hypothetical protein